LLPPAPGFHVSTSSQSDFQLGGKVVAQGSASLRSDVGATASLKIRFDEG
jgi:hypothetical protein